MRGSINSQPKSQALHQNRAFRDALYGVRKRIGKRQLERNRMLMNEVSGCKQICLIFHKATELEVRK